jgi:DNA-binding NarL/FixJ family response regulator
MKILVIDDHVLIRRALSDILKELRDDACVLEAADGHESMQLVEHHPDLDLIILDLNLPDRDGFSMLAELRRRYPAIGIVVLSASNDGSDVRRALDFGALGYIPKSTACEVILRALQLVFSGGMYIPTEALESGQPSPEENLPKQLATSLARLAPADLGLTDRQMEVLALLMQGKSNKAISRALNVAEATVKNHITVILKALKASSRAEAIVAAAGKIGLSVQPAAKL